MCVITNRGVSCDLGTSVLRLFVHLRCHQWWGLWPGLPPTLTAWGEKERTREHHTELSLLTREQNEYIRGGTQTVLQYPSQHHLRRNSGILCRIVQEEWLDRMLEDQLQSRGLHLPGGETEYEGELIPGGDRHDIVAEVTPLLALLDWYFRLLFNLIQSYSIPFFIVLNSWMYDVCCPSYCFY